MNMQHSEEDALRPLYITAPQNQPKQAAFPGKVAFLTAFASYPLAYFYVSKIMMGTNRQQWTGYMLVFMLVYMAGVEIWARAARRQAAPRFWVWGLWWAILGAAHMVYGARAGGLGILCTYAWHFGAVYYTLARTGLLAAGQTNSMILLDAWAGLVQLPFGNFVLRAQTLWRGLRTGLRSVGEKTKGCTGVVFSVVLALLLCGVAWGQLAAADPHFAALGDRFLKLFDFNIDELVVIKLVLSLPVGAWLFGLVGGAMRRNVPPHTEAGFYRWLARAPHLPASTGLLVPGALCVVYALFFALQAGEFAAALGANIALSAPTAARFAVDGFWELCRILLLDFAVLAALHFFGAAPLGGSKIQRAVLLFFGGFSLGFALLAAAKLGVYVVVYGPTPRRMLAGWFLGVLLIWCVLALVWLVRRIPAAKCGLVVLAFSFALFCCVDVEKICIDNNIDRAAAGSIHNVDGTLLRSCIYARDDLYDYTAERLKEINQLRYIL